MFNRSNPAPPRAFWAARAHPAWLVALSLLAVPLFDALAAEFSRSDTALDLPVKVSENHRFLVTSNGQPFFYLGDTAWGLFSRLNREDAAQYLAKRSAQGFTVIQAALTFRPTNIYGRSPFLENDPARPAMTAGSDPANPEQYDFWDHADYLVDQAGRLWLHLRTLPHLPVFRGESRSWGGPGRQGRLARSLGCPGGAANEAP